MNEQLSGTVDRFLYQNTDTGFSVLLLQMETQSIIVTGSFVTINPGQEITVHGNWITHPKFGKQFQASSCTALLPASTVGLKKYLASGMIKGIGPVYAEKMVKKFGATILEIIDTTPDRLVEVPGIGPKRIEKIKQGWQDQKEIANIMVFLQEKGVSPAYAAKIYKRYGKQSVAIVQENPYRLAYDIWGIGFKIADAIAERIGIAKNSIARIKAGILYVITTHSSSGHVYCFLDELRQKTIETLELDAQSHDTIKLALHELYESNEIKLISYAEKHYITLSQYYQAEKSVAQLIAALQQQSVIQCDINQVYEDIRTQSTLALNEDQQRAILACLQSKITIITGGPGTGKTTLIKQLLQILDKQQLRYRLAAPTGRAAKRMFEGTGKPAATIHRLLEFDPTRMTFVHNESNALKLDVLIVDEASMIDIFLAHSLLKAIPLQAHLVLIGDTDQLPSVGAGNFLNDLIASGKIPTVRLIHIFRQAQDSLIIINAHRINRGEFPTSSVENSKKDFVFIHEQHPELAIEHIKKIITKLPADIPIDDCMVLVPMNKGVAGAGTLNHQLQAFLNQQTRNEVVRSGTRFKERDRVMQIRNNYDKLVFNGDIGSIEAINADDQEITVRFLERMVSYTFNELDELVLAYAISIHKSQGSEYGAIIVPLFMQHFMLLQRNLIYTAITRAKKRCFFIGQPKALAMALKNNKQIHRITLLKTYLTTDLASR